MSTDSEDKIFTKCLELFFKFGLKCISVDDICNQIGISKKTFYQHFKNKNDVVKKIAWDFIKKNAATNREIIENDKSILEKIFMIYENILKQFHSCTPRFIYDIKKYHPDIYELFAEFKDKELNYAITELIKQGKKEGVFRDEIDEEIICRLHLHKIDTIINGSLLPEKNITDPYFLEVMTMSLIGISTLKGHEKIQQKLNII